MSRRHTGLSGSVAERPGNQGETATTSSSTLDQLHPRVVSIDDLIALSQRLLNLENVCRSYSGTVGDECASIRAELNRLLRYE